MAFKESDLAKIIIEHFEADGYEVYKEVVNTGKGKNRADIIAVKDGEYTVIETKLSFGLTVIEQSFKWKPFCHFSYIFVTRSTKRNARLFGYNMCRDFGVGVIDVGKKGDIRFVHDSSYTSDPELPQLYEEQKDQEAGVKPSKDSYITPFKITCRRLVEHITTSGKMPLLTAIKEIEHHYKSDASAKNALTKLIKIGVLPDLIVYKEGRTTYVSLC